MTMLVEIFYKQELYSRFKIDYTSKTLEVIEEPNREIRFVDSIFEYSDGFRFDFKTVSTFSADNTVQNMSRCCDTIYYPAWQTVLALWFVLRFLKSGKERILIYD